MVISNLISIKVSQLIAQKNGTKAIEKIKSVFTYKNPDHVEATKWGRSTWKIEEYIRTYHILGDEIRVNRGGLEKVESILKSHQITYDLVDFTQVCEPVKIIKNPKFKLREDQAALIKELHKEFKKMPIPQGIVNAQTSFGKTFTMIYFAHEIGQPLLVLVHTTFMQKQWMEELSDNFGIDKKDIGGAGGVFAGKPRCKKVNVALYHSMSKKEINILFRDFIGFLLIDEGQKAAIQQFQDAIKPFRARYRITCTANHERKDGKTFVITDLVGGVLYVAPETESNSKIFCNIFSTRSKWNPHDDIDWSRTKIDEKTKKEVPYYHDGYTTRISEAARNDNRNIQIARSAARKMKEGKIVIIFVERKEQAGALAKILSKFRVHLLIGPVPTEEIAEMDLPQKAKDFLLNNDPDKALDTAKDLALHRNLDCIICTQKGEVGLSIETLDHGIVTTPVGNNLERFNQLIGRVERQHKDKRLESFGEKPTPTIEVIVDDWDSSYNSWTQIKRQYADRIIKNPYLIPKG